MKRWLVVAAVLGVVATAAVALVALGRGPEVTTASPDALAEFNLAMDAQMKLYHDEARQHLERAVALDPDFVLAKLMLAEFLSEDKERRAQLRDQVAAADLDRLSERERYLVRRMLAFRAEQPEEIDRLTDEYLDRHPNDPWVLNFKANRLWGQGNMADAERFNRRLIEVNPNWVIAYNMLGYGAMDQGEFAEAEEHFISYRFIAPDQANPHDSLGELYILLGRYDEAVASLEEALRIKPDFWASYDHLALAHMLRRDWSAVDRVLGRMTSAEGFPVSMAEAIRCAVGAYRLALEGAWAPLLDFTASSCPKGLAGGDFVVTVTHRALCRTGRFDEATAVEGQVREVMEKKRPVPSSDEKMAWDGMLIHMEGVRLALAGDLAAAEEKLRAADAILTYRQVSLGLMKLLNRGALAEVLEARGETAEAARLLNAMRAVNAPLVTDFETGPGVLGLSAR